MSLVEGSRCPTRRFSASNGTTELWWHTFDEAFHKSFIECVFLFRAQCIFASSDAFQVLAIFSSKILLNMLVTRGHHIVPMCIILCRGRTQSKHHSLKCDNLSNEAVDCMVLRLDNRTQAIQLIFKLVYLSCRLRRRTLKLTKVLLPGIFFVLEARFKKIIVSVTFFLEVSVKAIDIINLLFENINNTTKIIMMLDIALVILVKFIDRQRRFVFRLIWLDINIFFLCSKGSLTWKLLWQIKITLTVNITLDKRYCFWIMVEDLLLMLTQVWWFLLVVQVLRSFSRDKRLMFLWNWRDMSTQFWMSNIQTKPLVINKLFECVPMLVTFFVIGFRRSTTFFGDAWLFFLFRRTGRRIVEGTYFFKFFNGLTNGQFMTTLLFLKLFGCSISWDPLNLDGRFGGLWMLGLSFHMIVVTKGFWLINYKTIRYLRIYRQY